MRATHPNWISKLCALTLVFALVPGAVEVMENVGHWLSTGHSAHSSTQGDDHTPTDREHGCTATAHVCGCHASLAFLHPQTPCEAGLHAFGSSSLPNPTASPRGYWPTVERPPRA